RGTRVDPAPPVAVDTRAHQRGAGAACDDETSLRGPTGEAEGRRRMDRKSGFGRRGRWKDSTDGEERSMLTTLPLVQPFAADGSALSEVRMFVRARAEEANLPASATGDLVRAVTEACNEMLAHEQGSRLLVSWWVHDDAVEIRLKDEGVIASPRPVQ